VEVAVGREPDVLSAKDGRKFDVECRAGTAGELRVGTDSVCVKVGQRVRMDGAEEIWHSIGVYAKEDESGSLVIRVLVFNPDWDEPLQIASITSRPGDQSCETSVGCNLDHVTA
jgi:hypothetical protein